MQFTIVLLIGILASLSALVAHGAGTAAGKTPRAGGDPVFVANDLLEPLDTFQRVLNARWENQSPVTTTTTTGTSSSTVLDDLCLRVTGAFAVEIDRKDQVAQLAKTQPALRVCEWFKQQQQRHQHGTTNQKKDSSSSFVALSTHPEQIHISITDVPGNVSVIWTTNTDSSNSEVCWWPQQRSGSTAPQTQNNQQCANGTVWTYDPISVIPWKGNLHGAFMTGLEEGEHYCYTVGDPTLKANNSFSTPVCFRAPKLSPNLKNDEDEDRLLIALGGDMGSYQLFGHVVAQQMRHDELSQNLTFDAFWLIGDIAYSTLDPPHWNFEFFWDVFLQQEESFANHVPLLVSYGNHDFAGGDSGAYLNRFQNPTTGRSNSKFYWSYDHGPIRYVSMCTEVGLNPVACDYAPGSPQYQWIEQQFQTINRTQTPWLIFAGHRPMYSSDKAVDSGNLQKYIEPLILKYGVDVELSGHMHETELCAPAANDTAYMQGVVKVKNGTQIASEKKGETEPAAATEIDEEDGEEGSIWRMTNPAAPVHMTLGIMGALINEHFTHPQPSWSLYRRGALFSDAYGYAQASISRSWFNVTVLKHGDASQVMWGVEIHKSR